jgi:hypothetical protein
VEIRKGIKLKYQGSDFCCMEIHSCLPMPAVGSEATKNRFTGKIGTSNRKVPEVSKGGNAYLFPVIALFPKEG